jgi:hypothetical protein
LLTGGIVLEMWHEKLGKQDDENQDGSNGENLFILLLKQTLIKFLFQ